MDRECIGCGHDVPVGFDRCPRCTAPFKEPLQPTNPTKAAEDKIFYQSGNVLVTTTRFVTDGQTYAMRNITSVKTGETPRKIGWQFLGCLLTFLLGSAIHLTVGIILTGLLIYWFWKNGGPEYQIIIATAGGEAPAYTSQHMGTIFNIQKALSDAIIARG